MNDSEPTKHELLDRIEQLEEQQQQLVEGAVDAQGRSWTVSDFLNMGLTRRQAMTAVGAIAGGATLGTAIRKSIGIASADASTSDDDGDVGTPENRVDVFADGVDVNTISLSSAPSDYFLPWKLEGSKSADGANDINYSFESDAQTRLLVFDDVDPGTGGATGGLEMRYDNDSTISYTSYMADGTVLNKDHFVLHDNDSQTFSGHLLFHRESGGVRSNLAFRYDRNVLDYGSTPNELTLTAGTSINISGADSGFSGGAIYEYSLQY